MKQLKDMQNSIRMPFDETEAYLRHRARVHEREKREKLKKQGKLEAYLAELEKNKPKPEPKEEPKEEQKMPSFEDFMKEYYESRKQEKENLISFNVSCQHDREVSTEERKDVYSPEQVKKKTKRRRKPKKKSDVPEEEIILLDDAEFKPQLAGRTGLPTFFFSNIVKQNSTALQEAQAKHRIGHHHHKNKKHHKWSIFLSRG